MLKINYDQKFDVLYIKIGDSKSSYGDEDVPGLVVFRNIETDVITGITIFDFKKRMNDKSILDLDLPIDIDLKSDLFTKIN